MLLSSGFATNMTDSVNRKHVYGSLYISNLVCHTPRDFQHVCMRIPVSPTRKTAYMYGVRKGCLKMHGKITRHNFPMTSSQATRIVRVVWHRSNTSLTYLFHPSSCWFNALKLNCRWEPPSHSNWDQLIPVQNFTGATGRQFSWVVWNVIVTHSSWTQSMRFCRSGSSRYCTIIVFNCTFIWSFTCKQFTQALVLLTQR